MGVRDFLKKLGHRPFLRRYLKRDEILSNIAECDTTLNDALGMFSVRVGVPFFTMVDTDALLSFGSSLSRSVH